MSQYGVMIREWARTGGSGFKIILSHEQLEHLLSHSRVGAMEKKKWRKIGDMDTSQILRRKAKLK